MEIKNVAVIGGGLMGRQIALNAAIHGYNVKLTDSMDVVLKAVEQWAGEYFAGRIAKGRMSKEQVDAVNARFAVVGSIQEAVCDADLMIEAVIENEDVKKSVFAEAAQYLPEAAIVASNSSRMPSSKFAESVKDSTKLIEKLCKLTSKHFRSHVKNIHTVKDWIKADNTAMFINIDVIDIAINSGKQVQYDYNKYGTDKELHKSSFQRVTPYQLILHNQRYYLMGYSDYWGNMVFHRLDRISNISIYDQPAHPIRSIPGYESGIDYKRLSTTMPYLYSDKPERIEFIADAWVIDQVIDWFGKDLAIRKTADPEKIIIGLWASPYAMSLWALQYLNYVEVISPAHLREKIKDSLTKGLAKYE